MFSTPFTPSPSPPSSPALDPNSSPPSSPGLTPYVLSTPPQNTSPLSHPFAASTKANRAPPQYEKRFVAPDDDVDVFSSSSRPSAARYRLPRDLSYGEDEYLRDVPCAAPEDPERIIWDEAVARAIDSGNGSIELSDQNLTYIPSSIADLGNFYVPPDMSERINASGSPHASTRSGVPGGRLFSRVTTAPASTSWGTRLFAADRARSAFVDASVGTIRHEIQLFLTRNQITTLPRELFCLSKMTVLIMRGNQLTCIPPEIARLTNLRELNVSNNRLQYLPSEMYGMSLKQLSLFPNPFLSEPMARPASITRAFSAMRSSRATIPAKANEHDTPQGPERTVSKTKYLDTSPVPSCVELCTRLLISPYEGHATLLGARYQLPLSAEYHIPEHLQGELNAAVPGAVPPNAVPRARRKERDGVGIGMCSAPKHKGVAGGGTFYRHAEERYTWEGCVAGCRVGGKVAVKWRGCMRGCLDFLDGKVRFGDEIRVEVAARPTEMAGDEDVEMGGDDADEMEVVQVVNFAGGELGEEDFDISG